MFDSLPHLYGNSSCLYRPILATFYLHLQYFRLLLSAKLRSISPSKSMTFKEVSMPKASAPDRVSLLIFIDTRLTYPSSFISHKMKLNFNHLITRSVISIKFSLFHEVLMLLP